MTWLIVAGDLTPLGGMDAANHALARYLAPRDEIHLVTHRAWPDLAAFPNVTVHRVWRPLDRHLLGSPLLSRAGQRVWRRLRSSNARAIVNGGNCRIAGVNWVHYLHAAHPLSAEGSFSRRAKVALTHRRDLSAERAALRVARVVICNSRRTRDDVIERIGVDPARIRVIYYGGDPVRFSLVNGEERVAAKAALSQPAGRPLVGFVGALGDRRKAFDTVFSAWSELCRCREWDADLIVVGQGTELAAWRRRANAAGLGDRIRFAGFRTDVPQILAALDALVHPARYEAYGLSVREALCRGVPAIVSASAGVAEHYPPELAELLIADPNDPAELGAKLVAWRREMERVRSAVVPLSAALRSRTWDAMAEQIAACAREQA
jgi:glycosyltransferase involved in cell wall biosynthesis